MYSLQSSSGRHRTSKMGPTQYYCAAVIRYLQRFYTCRIQTRSGKEW